MLKSNLIGAYNVFEGCRLAGVKRVVFASSIQASAGYRREAPYAAIAEGRFENLPEPIPMVTEKMPVRPLNVYASSKVWGEALARTYSDTHGMSCICLRIGWVVAADRPPNQRSGDIWCSQRDIAELIKCCIDAGDEIRFDIFYGMSDNRRRWVDIAHARERVGYVPQDGAED